MIGRTKLASVIALSSGDSLYSDVRLTLVPELYTILCDLCRYFAILPSRISTFVGLTEDAEQLHSTHSQSQAQDCRAGNPEELYSTKFKLCLAMLLNPEP